MDTISMIRRKAASDLKTIALPEMEDERTLEAARILEKEKIVKVVFVDAGKVAGEEKEKYAQQYYELRKAKGMTIEQARQVMQDPLYIAEMMARNGVVDGCVAGASHTTADVARAAIHCLGINERFGIAASCFIMAVPDCEYGDNGTFVFADCGIIPDPNPRQLGCIAVASAELAKKVLGLTPRVAFLSYSTRGSSAGRLVDKVKEALALARQMQPDLLVDGELQVDAAIIPEVTQIKYPDSPIQGRANVLIFPDLNSGNISYKLVQRLAKARALGPLIMGLNKPCSDLSRGCTVDDIVDCAAVTAIRAQA
ncbi:MAG: phosphate acetyltransferase [Candidatus Omnitrophica bacterium]|nr:phosphate acetyltransferase [Candidatus Omnitrophota bacterium]MDD5655456.1 phosphate acetyltransferase [Candidatus Omnitrophota bacterium]